MSALAERPSALPLDRNHARPVARPWRDVAVVTEIAAIAAEWDALERHALVTPYQSRPWVEAFAGTVGEAHGMVLRYALIRDAGGEPAALLPLVITRRNGCRFAEFIGGKHANYHMGLFAPAFAASLDEAATDALLREVAVAIGGLDAFVFVNQPTLWQGQANPLAALAAGPSPSAAYKLALVTGDCAGTLRRSMSSHAHKKLKNKRNRFASFGEARLVRARDEAEAARILDAFLTQKAARFKMMGVPDPFADPAVRAFIAQGARMRDGAVPALELYSLDVEGRSVATYVGAVQGTRFSGMATAFDMTGEIAKTSPGEILLVDLIKHKCQEGVTVFDLGVGEARYKTTICDDKDELVDSFLPLTAKGRGLALVAKAKRAAKRRIKSSPLLLKLAQRATGLLRRNRSAGEE
jgi:CelD/BcsL family acetyltransferase involved in cellulose biosynthesis